MKEKLDFNDESHTNYKINILEISIAMLFLQTLTHHFFLLCLHLVLFVIMLNFALS